MIDKVHESWAPATIAWQQHRTTSQGKSSISPGLDSAMDSAIHKVDEAYNAMVDVLGRRFANGDGA